MQKKVRVAVEIGKSLAQDNAPIDIVLLKQET